MATTMTDLYYKMRQRTGALVIAWRMPQLFDNVQGEPLIRRADVSSKLKGGMKQKWYEWPVEFRKPFNASAGSAGHDGSSDGEVAKLYTKRVFNTCEVDHIMQEAEADIEGVANEVLDKIDHTIKNVNPTLGMHHFWLDGSGRRACIAKLTNTGSVTRIHLKPLWAQDALPGALDATKYIVNGMWVDLTTFDESTRTGTRISGATAEEVVAVNVGTVAFVNGTEDSPYIDVSPQISSGVISGINVGAGTSGSFVSLENPAGQIDGEPIGAMGWAGKGTNENRGVNNAFPAFGYKKYATIDRSLAANARFQSYNYTEHQTNPYAEITLTGTVMEDWLGAYYASAPKGTYLDAIVCHTKVRQAYFLAHANAHTLNATAGEIAVLGYKGPVFNDPHSNRQIPIYGTEDCPRQSMWGFSWKTMLQGEHGIPGWIPGDVGPWRYMQNIEITSNIMRAVHYNYGMFIQHAPATSTSIWFIDETPSF